MLKNDDFVRLEKLIASMSQPAEASRNSNGYALLRENLQAARRSFLGSMHAEYRGNLRDAIASRSCIADKTARLEMKKTLQDLLGSETHARVT